MKTLSGGVEIWQDRKVECRAHRDWGRSHKELSEGRTAITEASGSAH